MDQPQKTRVEKRIVMGLLAIFLLSLLGSLGRAGFLRSPAGAPSSTPAVISERPRSFASVAESLRTAEDQLLHATSGPGAPSAAASPSVETPALYTAQSLRDPLVSLLRPPATATALGAEAEEASAQQREATTSVGSQGLRPSGLIVQGLLWGGSKPTAIINHRVYGVGDTVEGGVIRSIDRTGVDVESDGTTSRLTTRTD